MPECSFNGKTRGSDPRDRGSTPRHSTRHHLETVSYSFRVRIDSITNHDYQARPSDGNMAYLPGSDPGVSGFDSRGGYQLRNLSSVRRTKDQSAPVCLRISLPRADWVRLPGRLPTSHTIRIVKQQPRGYRGFAYTSRPANQVWSTTRFRKPMSIGSGTLPSSKTKSAHLPSVIEPISSFQGVTSAPACV
jgi:hypothetical protein